VVNKRRHKRVPLAASATIRYNSGEGPETIQSLIADISLSGIGIYSDKAIGEGTEMSVEIDFISTEGLITKASVMGESVYAREMGGGMFFMGIEFDEEIDAEKQPALYDHLGKILSQD
jgi:c-di-GMP-binding flagellar brake protein YcgR